MDKVLVLFAVSMLVAISPLLYLLVDAIIDIRDTSKKRKQIEKELNEQFARNYKE